MCCSKVERSLRRNSLAGWRLLNTSSNRVLMQGLKGLTWLEQPRRFTIKNVVKRKHCCNLVALTLQM